MHIYFETDLFLKLVNEMKIEDMQKIYDIKILLKNNAFLLQQ